MDHPTHNAIVNFIWGIADDVLRDVYVRGKYRDVILPMTIVRRLDCLLEPTKEKVLEQYEQLKKDNAGDFSELTKITGYPFYNISRFTLKQLLIEYREQEQKLAEPRKQSRKIIEPKKQLKSNFQDYLNGFSKNVQEISSRFNLQSQIERLGESGRLYGVIDKFLSDRINLSPFPVLDDEGEIIHEGLSNLGMGYVFEELIRRFNEENNDEAGEHFTPRDIIRLMVNLIFIPVQDRIKDGKYRVYDCACGSGGMLTESEAYLQELSRRTGKKIEIELYGQEVNGETFAICQADMLIQGKDPRNIRCGSTLSEDAFPNEKFDFMLANPPYGKAWKLDKEMLEEGKGKNRTIKDSRFIVDYPRRAGEKLELFPRVSDGQLLFLVNKLSKMNWDTALGSRIAIVHNGSALFTGDAGQGESNIRQWIIEYDWLECIIGLPQNMFYNTGIGTYIWVLSNRKPRNRKGKVQLIDASEWCEKLRRNLGQKNCELTENDIQRITDTFLDFEETPQSKILDNDDLGYNKIVVERPLRLRFQITTERLELFRQLASSDAEVAIETLLDLFGYEPYQDFNQVMSNLEKSLKIKKLKLKVKDLKLIRDCFTERNEIAEPVILRQTEEGTFYEPDPELRDTENVPLKEDIDEYFEREVSPHVPDAWIDYEKTVRGYETSFTKYFYKFKPLRSLEEIAQDIFTLEEETEGLLLQIIGEQE